MDKLRLLISILLGSPALHDARSGEEAGPTARRRGAATMGATGVRRPQPMTVM